MKTMFAVFAIAVGLLTLDLAAAQGDKPLTFPPRFIPGAALYDEQHNLVNVLLGKEVFPSLKLCMEDAQVSVNKAAATGKNVEAFCLPVHTYTQGDWNKAQQPDTVIF